MWVAEISDHPNGGYISKGLTKYCFEGRYEDKKYAILQGKIQCTTNEHNTKDLKCELRLLAYGDYFMKSFAKRSEHYKKAMPAPRWNYNGAFVGTVEEYDPKGDPEDSPLVSLGHDTFLAVPYLVSAEERKFSGADEAGHNPNDVLGRWMDAYSHHVCEDSNGAIVLTDLQGFVYSRNDVVLFDPQAHTNGQAGTAGCRGFWDKGQSGIDAFKQQHKCRTLCKDLGLTPFPVVKPASTASVPQPETENVRRNGPLRTGWV
ncbi:hypothetical protein NMY22_g6696 [Coprinellus aureogranulatus]|nr:hypothetical protein NMY22_g6696 [Coprinellus aureogranulatus]